MTQLVGYAKCPCCGFKDAGVFRNKRGKLVLNCRKKEGGAGCSTFLFQSNSAQQSLKNMTRFISENPTPVAEVSEVQSVPVSVPVVEKVEPVVSETPQAPVPEKAPEPAPVKPEKKEAFSFFK